MLKVVTNLFHHFFPRSVSGVMAGFQKTVNDLSKVSKHHAIKGEKYETKIENLLDKLDVIKEKQRVSELESDLAFDLADKLQAHFGLPE